MSGFLSRKYLQYREIATAAPEPRVIDHDLPCTGCGYNLRGLTYGRNCPECGQMIGRAPVGASPDPLLTAEDGARRLISIGLLVGSLCLFIAMAARFWLFIDSVVGIGLLTAGIYLTLGFVLSAAWCAACVMMIRGIPRGGPRWTGMAQLAAWSQLLWIPGYALFALRVNATSGGWGSEEALHAANLIVRGLAGVGALGVAYYMLRAAEDAELEDAARRLNNVLWMLPIFTVLTANVPAQIGWVAAILFFMLLIVWCTLMWMWTRAFWEMYQHVAWAIRTSTVHAGQLQRIAERKREIEREVEARIRPLGKSKPVMIDDDRFCTACEYNLRGLPMNSACPECGRPILATD